MPTSKPKQGMSLHKWIATGGKPSERKNANRDFGTTKENSSKKK